MKPDTEAGKKQVSITVVDKAGDETTYEVSTDGEYLIDAMDAAKEDGLTYEGDEGEFGLMIDTVNGETAVYTEDGAGCDRSFTEYRTGVSVDHRIYAWIWEEDNPYHLYLCGA